MSDPLEDADPPDPQTAQGASLRDFGIVMAQRPHRCCVCGVIAVRTGDRYRRETYTYRRRVRGWVCCDSCAELLPRVYASLYTAGVIVAADYDMWAREFADDPTLGPAARAYLNRRGIDHQEIAE